MRIILILMVLAFSCQTKKIAHQKTIEDHAIEILGKDFISFFNQSKTFVLYLQKNENPSRITKGLVFDTQTKNIVQSLAFMPGYVKWIDDNTIEVFDAPEVMRENDDVSNHVKQIRIKKNESQDE
ncbi:MAG: hypothetical protein JSU09_13505 [Bacteroidetes bacterium]|nr:hypothetical protein [Bacteroidota bacterium]